MNLPRRKLLQGAALGAAAFSVPHLGLARGGKSWRPNDELRVAVIGIRSRGRNHIAGLHRLEGVRVVAVCDVDPAFLKREKEAFTARGEELDTYTDLREVLDRDDIDIVASATPNHWHALLTIWACQAGKDVYIEKPVSHNVWEGRQMVRAARKHGRIVQTGTQCRSSHALRDAIAWLQAGHLGQVLHAQGLCYKPRRSIGKVAGPQPTPVGLDYGMWLGPADDVPLMRSRLHYDWHWDHANGNGDMGNQGIHQMDICRWALGHDSLSSRIVSVGGRLGYDDDGNTPNTQLTLHEFESGAPILFEVRGLPVDAAAQAGDWRMDRYNDVAIGALIHCEGGTLRVPSYSSAQAFDLEGQEVASWKGADDHYANFIAAVRARDAGLLTADIEEGHLSSGLCHLGNISHLTGADATPDELRELVAGRGPAIDALDRMATHLAANGIDLEAERLTAGSVLELDPGTERFTNNPLANRLLTRAYREPFVVPTEL
ncbi:MAG: Gfo/Idh/MocA family oxidoreductase [Planctomycetota bacterium]|nr:Gfo/Idh/MocA family oxidoreductase [Planctomycetota bacterium]